MSESEGPKGTIPGCKYSQKAGACANTQIPALSNESFIDLLIREQEKAIKIYYFFAGSIFVIGIVLILVVFLLLGSKLNETSKVIVGIGAAFVSSISTFHIREVIERKEKINFLKFVRKLAPDNRLNDILWEKIKRVLTG